MWAAKDGKEAVVKELLQYPEELNDRFTHGLTKLMTGALYGSLEIVQ